MSQMTRLRRLPLRDLISHVEKRCREMTEHLQMDLAPAVNEFHDLTRPKRKKSVYPAIKTLYNHGDRVHRLQEYANQLQQEILECVQTIKERIDES